MRRPGWAALLLLLLSACAGQAPSSPAPTGSPTSPEGSPSPDGQATVVVGPEAVAGWWDGRAWVDARDRLADIPLKGDDTYTVLRLGQPATREVGSSPKEGCETIPGTVEVDIPGVSRDYEGVHNPPPVAVTGAGVEPAPVELLQPAAYREPVLAELAGRGIQVADPGIVQILRTDLESDGKDEVLLVAERLTDPESLFAAAGDYSMLFLRRVVDEQPVTVAIAESVARPGPGETPFVNSFRVAAVADLNGDGRSEVAVSAIYYEGASVAFYELDSSGDPVEVLVAGCGA